MGSRLYIPISLFREEVGERFAAEGFVLTDSEIDEQVRSAGKLLPNYSITFSPFSGPARGGLQLGSSYVGFVSIRPKGKQHQSSTERND